MALESPRRQLDVKTLPKKWLLLSFVAVLVAGTACFGVVIHLTPGYLFRNDGTGYFLLAQSMVLDLDTEVTDDYLALDARVPPESPAMSGLRVWREPNPERVVLPWPIGSGLVMAPFYAAGYGLERVVAVIAGREADPYGLLPQVFYGLGSLFYGWLGFWATFLCCRRLVSSRLAMIAAAAAMLAGPAVFYIFFNPTMAHASSLGLAALFVALWSRGWEEVAASYRLAAGLGLLLGLLIIVRYQNAVFGLLLLGLLWRLSRRASLKAALRAGAVASVVCLVPLLVQVAHLAAVEGGSEDWRSGEVLILGRNPIDLSSPFLFEALFSCRHGAVYWSPVVGLSGFGLLWVAGRVGWARMLFIVLLVDVYLIGCLRGPPQLMESLAAPPSPVETHWSGGHAFGMRYLTECAPLLALGLAILLRQAGTGFRRKALVAILSLLVAWNGLLLLAYGSGEISRVGCVTYPEMASGAMRALGRL